MPTNDSQSSLHSFDSTDVDDVGLPKKPAQGTVLNGILVLLRHGTLTALDGAGNEPSSVLNTLDSTHELGIVIPDSC